MPTLTYRITTLGCRVNHAESREIESVLAVRGLVPAAKANPADLEVVHTCTVTSTAAAKSRQAIRRARRRQAGGSGGSGRVTHADTLHRTPPAPMGTPADTNPHVIVTGCYAASHPAEAAAVSGEGGHVIPHEAEDGSSLIRRFENRVDTWLDGRTSRFLVRPEANNSSVRTDGQRAPGPPRIVPLPVVPLPGGGHVAVGGVRGRHVRAELRIQDGCDASCTFCIIPRIRRTLRSKTLADAVAEARALVNRGHREVVLTGIFLGAYGHETALRRRQARPGASPMADLVDAVAQVSGLERLRISSLEPGDVSEPLLDAMLANAPTVVPHLHLPLQSGSDAVLARMNRQYRLGPYLEMIDQVNAALTRDDGPSGPLPPAITTDVICGFPGETEDDFEQTVEVARRVGFLHMHVFPYSPRAGTAAARWTDRHVPESTARARVRRLIDLEEDPDHGLSIRGRRRLLGRRVRVIVEQRDPDAPGVALGRCDHYTLLRVTGAGGLPRGEVIEVEVNEVSADATVGTLVGRQAVRLPVLAAQRVTGRS